MEFNSLAYALFFALVIALYYAPFMRTTVRQNALVLCASYCFYGAWDWRFLGLIILTTLSSYLTGLAICGHRRRWALVANIVLNIGILGLFKYFNFFGENIAFLLRWAGWEVDWVFLKILLPVGISFYTFQAIGYTVDVWRGDVRPTRNLLLFGTFIAYFPQLVAGPIERAARLLPQLWCVHHWSYNRAVTGMRQILWGMFKKIAVADPCGKAVETFYSAGDSGDDFGLRIFLAAVFFAVQIYCDFSGYCDIAQGSARILGVELVDNFRRPFFSRSYLEVWRRWHVSLMEWFASYVYFPLGGSRVGAFRKYFNLMTVFLLSGVWHGAAWGYILWGAYCGVVCILEKMAGAGSYSHKGQPGISDLPRMAYTFALFITGCVFVRVPDTMLAAKWILEYVLPWSAVFVLLSFPARYFGVLISGLDRKKVTGVLSVLALVGIAVAAWLRPSAFWFHFYWVLAALVILLEWITRHKDMTIFPIPSHRTARFGVYLLLYLCILLYGFFHLPPIHDETQFIYFQF